MLRAVASTAEGITFNTVRRIVGIDSRTTSARFKELQELGWVACEDTLYKATPRGRQVLEVLALLHMETDG